MRFRTLLVPALGVVAVSACKEKVKPIVYQAVPVETRDIVVSAQASGRIIPDTLIEVKTRASGPVEDIKVETGEHVQRGQLLLTIDPRLLKNSVDQAQAQLDVAKIQLKTSEIQWHRADSLLAEQTIARQDYETYELAYYNAKANAVNAQIALDNAKINFDDAQVRAPVTGTIIEKGVERGMQIASATSNVGGGTSLMKMADLSLVQVQTLVDETDIGKIKPGMDVSIVVDAFPNRPFQGTVLKIEPNDTTVQNVTMYPVRVRIENRDGLLMPGMNAEVQIHVGRKDQAVSVPVAALRTPRDVASAAQVLGLDPVAVQKQVEALQQQQRDRRLGGGGTDSAQSTTLGAKTPPTAGGVAGAGAGARAGRGGRMGGKGADASSGGDQGDRAGKGEPAANTMTTQDGRTITLPAGVTEQQVRDLFRKRFSGGTLTAQEEEMLAKVRSSMQRAGGGGSGRPQASNYQFGGSYIVFTKVNGQPTPTLIRTGLTDLDYSEVVRGLKVGDSVYLLPSASLVQSQQDMKNRIAQMTGNNLRQTPQTGAAAGGAGGAAGAGGGTRGAGAGGPGGPGGGAGPR